MIDKEIHTIFTIQIFFYNPVKIKFWNYCILEILFKWFIKPLKLSISVELARVQARWSESVTNDPDFLTVDEFLAFLHPEASPTQILHNVQDTFFTFGTNVFSWNKNHYYYLCPLKSTGIEIDIVSCNFWTLFYK